MESQIMKKISIVNNATSIVKLNKGFSHDKKYVIDNHYLIRLFPIKDAEHRREEYNCLHKLAAYSEAVPKAIAFDLLKENDLAYMILTYLPGVDGEMALSNMTQADQYRAGYQAGMELKKLHRLPAPFGYPSWYLTKKKKNDRYLEALKNINVDGSIKTMLENYIRKKEHLMYNRPNTFQHDDFHPANLLIHNGEFSGIIDFQRMDWGDPIHDLHKLGFFSKRISIPFTKGTIDGYHKNTGPDNEFWELYALYSAMHIVSALVWGKKLGNENFKRMQEYSHDVIDDHRNFEWNVPAWYSCDMGADGT